MSQLKETFVFEPWTLSETKLKEKGDSVGMWKQALGRGPGRQEF